jgi:NAD(P)-dependent dehydrogenase (short-subunit alcohol dehydrogenase family)
VTTDRRTAVITGGNKGIGLACGVALAAQGLDVVLMGRDEAALAEAVALADAAGPGTARGVRCDVADEASVTAAFDAVGRVDVLVANAGIAGSAPVHRTSTQMWEQTMAVNATGAFLTIRAVLPGMIERDWGRIVAMGSVASRAGGKYMGAYAASKHALLGLVRSVAAEVAGTGVTANTVCPAYVETEMAERAMAAMTRATGATTEQARRTLERMQPTGRLIRPEEVAAAVVYLASDAAAPVNGQSLLIDGGLVQG